MSQRRLTRGPRCGVGGCKSTYYHKADGQTYCENNHLAAGVYEYQIDDDEALASGLGSRRKRAVQQADVTEEESRVAYGRAGYAIFLQAYQLILRQQAKFLAKELDIPEFGSLLKDIWTIFLEAQGTEEQLPESHVSAEDDQMADSEASTPRPLDDVEPNETVTLSQEASGDDDSDRELMVEPEVSAAKEYSSMRYYMHRPLLIHSVALCYITLMLLRAPTTMQDFRKWIVSGQFPYVRAIRYVPVDLRSKMTPGQYESLEPQNRPRASRLWKWTQHTILFLNIHCGLELPCLNYRPILLEMIKDFLLPLDVLNATIKVMDKLSIDLAFRTTEKSPMSNVPPEIRVLCVMLVVAKLFYGLDGTTRIARSPMDPAARCPDLRDWHRAIRVLLSRAEGVDLVSKVKPTEALSMTNDAIDEYLLWFQRTWINDMPSYSKTAISTPQVILDMFPMQADSSLPQQVEAVEVEDRLDTINRLYSKSTKPQIRCDKLDLPGSRYERTTPGRSEKTVMFDDLIEYAAVAYSSTTEQLRRHVGHIEKLMSRIDPLNQ